MPSLKLRRIASLGAVCVLAACGGETVHRRNVIVLVDYSSSIQAADFDRFARALRRDVIPNLGPHDALAVFPVDAGAGFRDERIAALDLKDHDFTHQGDGVTHQSDSVLARLHRFVTSAADTLLRAFVVGRELRQRFGNETDILGAVAQAGAQLERNKEATGLVRFRRALLGEETVDVTNVLIICSDMVNESRDANFEKRPPDHGQVTELLSALRAQQRLPQLSGVDVFVMGRTGRNAKQVKAIHNFWADYFLATGANLVGYDFDLGSKLERYFHTS